MTDQRDPNDPNDDLEGFESFEEPMDDPMLEDEPLDDAALDADFQDLPEDDIDSDVFGEGEPAEIAPQKKTNWFNIGVAVIAIAVAGGLVWSKLGPTIMGDGTPVAMPLAPIDRNDMARSGQNDANAAAQAAVSPTSAAGPAQGGLLDDPEKFSTLAQNSRPVDVPGEEKAPVIIDPFAGLPTAPTQAAQAELNNSGVPMPAPIMAAPLSPDATSIPAPAAETARLPTPALATIPTKAQPPVAVVTTTETTMPAASTAPLLDDQPVPIANASLENKMNAMENRMNELDMKLSNAVERIENAAPADDSRLASIQTALQRLESRLDTIGAAPRQAAVAVRSDAEPAPVKRAATPQKAKAQPNKADQPYSPPSQAVNISASGGTGGWDLRGATNGRAIIAKGSDIREVGVGDTVPGMGQITGVAQVNGAWVVQGTMARLSQ